MKIGLIGFPQTGKKTLFGVLTGEDLSQKHADPHKPFSGMAEVGDSRFDELVRIFKPSKQCRARLEMVLLPKIEEKTISQGNVFKEMGEVDALCHVVRVFEDASIYHLWGTIDPRRDIDYLYNELILHDLLFIEKRLERIEHHLKKVKEEAAIRERELLMKMRPVLESERPLRYMTIGREDERIIASYPFLTRKEIICVLNISEDDLSDKDRFQSLKDHYAPLNVSLLPVAVKAEWEIAQLESERERREFMEALGIEDTALHALTRMCIQSLGLISFFTVRSNEVRQWFIKKGSTALDAAGAIHTDMARGFIRAEVIKLNDLGALGSEEKVKSAGKLYVKGKDYVVEDGDILGIRFNV